MVDSTSRQPPAAALPAAGKDWSKSTTATAPPLPVGGEASNASIEFERELEEGRHVEDQPLDPTLAEGPTGETTDQTGAAVAAAATVTASGETLDEELEGAVQELLSFDGAEQLLRSAPLDVLLAGGGRIFSTSRGTEETYSLSSQTDRIGYFVSHNWTVHRIVKFLALAFKFNLHDALAACITVSILCLAIGWAGWQPLFPAHDQDYDITIACRIFVVPITVLTLCFGRCCHRRGSGPSVFLDKVCIHQADRSLQRAGIRKLGAFMRQIVQTNIVALMKASKRVRRHAKAKEALEAFDADVRDNVAHQFKHIFGHFAFSYSEYLVLALTVLTPTYVDEWASWLASDISFREFLGQHSLNIFWIFTGMTVWQLATEVVASWFVHLTGWREALWDISSNFVLIVLANSALELTAWLNERARTDDTLLACLLVGQVLTTAATWWLVPKVCSQHRRRRGRPAGPQEPACRITVGHISSNSSSLASPCSADVTIVMDEGGPYIFDQDKDSNDLEVTDDVVGGPALDLHQGLTGTDGGCYEWYSRTSEDSSCALEPSTSHDLGLLLERRTSNANVADFTLNTHLAEASSI